MPCPISNQESHLAFFYRMLMLRLVLVVSFSLYAQEQDNENPALDFYEEQARITEADA